MTGPRSGSSSKVSAMAGVAQLSAGVRSRCSPCPSLNRQVSGIVISVPPAASSKVVESDVYVATWPQRIDPAAMQPAKTMIKMDRPRARTQFGSAVCAETFGLVSTAIQPRPPSNAAGMAIKALVANPRPTMAAAVMTAPSACRMLASNLARIPGNASAPTTAPAPTAASKVPYRPAPPPGIARATSGSSAQ